MKVVKNDGLKEDFNEEKLYDSVYYSARETELDEDRSNEVAEKVIWEVKAWMDEHEDNVFTSEEIKEKVLEVLRDMDCDVCFMYKTHIDIN